MSDAEIREAYMDFLVDSVCETEAQKFNYRQMFEALASREFDPNTHGDKRLIFDEHRAMDGIDYRSHFAYVKGYDERRVRAVISGNCSVLEMMVALAFRIEDTIMCEANEGDRTYRWFWCMIESLGMTYMDDQHFDYYEFDIHMRDLMTREYARNGEGGLFFIPNMRKDMRKVDICTQMWWFLDDGKY